MEYLPDIVCFLGESAKVVKYTSGWYFLVGIRI